MKNEKIRNIAIIAHVDHGKTSLVDALLKQGSVFRENQVVETRIMDSNDLEKERGITILSKNCSCLYNDVKINIIDTPGHADFGGEVERVLKMVDGVLLVVDAYEGPMPQTRFVLERALALKLKVVVVVNKIDKPDARLSEVVDEVLELFLELDADEEQLNSPFVFASARMGTASTDINSTGTDMKPLFEKIIEHIPAPEGDETDGVQMLVSSAEHNDYVGKLAVGKLSRGSLSVGQSVVLCNYHDEKKQVRSKVVSLFVFEGVKRVPVNSVEIGEIVCVAGLEDIQIGDTICAPEKIEPVEFVKIAEPSVEMTFMVNDSPFAGKEGKFVTTRHIRDRLFKEAVKDLSLRVTDGDTADTFKVCGRGEMHLSILIENMRREGYEFQVSMPKVMYKTENGVLKEPIDKLIVDVPEASVGVVMEKMGTRKGELETMTPMGARMRLEFSVPGRGLFGFKSEFLTATKGEGIMNSVFDRYDTYRGEIDRRPCGSLVAHETGEAVAYGLFNAQDRGPLFVAPGAKVYEGMVVGENPKGGDIVVNVCKRKQMTNMRAAGSDDALRLTPPKVLSLEQAIEFIDDDELLEVTPASFRVRKKILNSSLRLKAEAKEKKKE